MKSTVTEVGEWRFAQTDQGLPDRRPEAEWSARVPFAAGESVPEQLWTRNAFVACSPEGVSFRVTAAEVVLGTKLEFIRRRCTTGCPHDMCGCHRPDWPTVKLPFEAAWRERSRALGEVKEIQPTMDWTLTSCFKGAVLGADTGAADVLSEFGFTDVYDTSVMGGGAPAAPPAVRSEVLDDDPLPWEKLRDTSLPMRHYVALTFYHDDLADTGDVAASLKVRVMDSFWYAALVQTVRVDDVVEREVVVRVYHEFRTCTLLRTVTWREQPHRVGGPSPAAVPPRFWAERLSWEPTHPC